MLKKILAYFLSIIILVGSTDISTAKISASTGNIIYAQDFEGANTGELPQGWTATNVVSGSAIAAVEQDTGNNRSLRISQSAAAPANMVVQYTLPVASEKLVLKYRIKADSTAGAFYLPTLCADSSGSYQKTAFLNMGGGYIKKSPDNAAWTNVVSIESGTWYNMELVVDNSTDSYDLYAYKDGFPKNRIITGEPTKYQGSSIDRINLGLYRTTVNGYNIDDIVVSELADLDRSQLIEAITAEIGADHGNPVYVLQPELYTVESWIIYVNAVEAAIGVERSISVTQQELDAAIAEIATAKAGLVPASSPSTDDIIYAQDFEGVAAGELPEGWNASNVTESIAFAAVTLDGESNRSLRISQSAAATANMAVQYTLPVSAEKLVLKYRIKADGTGGAFYLPTLCANASGSYQKTAILNMGGGYIKKSPDNQNWTNVAPVESDTWYNMELVVDNSTDSYDLYAYKDGSPRNLIIAGEATAYKGNTIDRINIGLFRTTVNGYNIDDIIVSKFVDVESVSLEQPMYILPKGTELTIPLTISPSDASRQTAVWSSSDTTVVTVDQFGTLKGQGAGTATITAMVEGKSASCLVEVLDRPLLTETITAEIGTNRGNPVYILPEGAYTAESWGVYVNAVEAAMIVERSITATQQEIVAAIAAIAAAKTALAPLSDEERELYVDPVGGSDAVVNDGSIDNPFRTIERARDVIRSAPKGKYITVYLRGGEYNYADREITLRSMGLGTKAYTLRQSALTFDERDSAPAGYEITYKAYPGEQPVISGGKRVTSEWVLYNAALNIYKTNIRDEFGEAVDTRQLYVNGQRAVVARSEGKPSGMTFEKSYGHTTTDADMVNWRNVRDIEFVYYDQWVQFFIKVDSITLNNGIAEINMNPDVWSAYTSGNAYIRDMDSLDHIENAYELLDSDGEWYLDRSNGDLFYKPRSGENMSSAEVVIPVVDELLYAKGSSADKPFENVHFEGITFEYAGWLRPNIVRSYIVNQNNTYRDDKNKLSDGAVTVENSSGISFVGNDFSKLGSTALLMRFGVRDAEIIGNKFTDLSAGGMSIEDPVQYVALEDVRIENNYIRSIGLDYAPASGISTASGKRVYIRHNEISELAYSAIHLGWHDGSQGSVTEHVYVENNYIHDLGRTEKVYDLGAIYTLGTNPLADAENPAYTVSGNYICNVVNALAALYADNKSTWWYAHDNVIDLRDAPPGKNNQKIIALHTNEGKNLRIVDNYTTTDSADTPRGENNTIEWKLYPNAEWPEAALDIIFNAGLEAGYQDIWDTQARFNQIVNPGFETRKEGQVWFAENAQWNRTTGEKHLGETSAKIIPAEAGGYIWQSVNVWKNMSYPVNVWVKSGSESNMTASLYVQKGEGENAQLIKLSEQTITSGGWTQLEGTLNYAVLGYTGDELSIPVKIFVQTNNPLGMPYYLDDFNVVEMNEIDMVVLTDAIAAAELLHDQAVEGEAAGQYVAGSKVVFEEAIEKAREVVLASTGESSFYLGLKTLYAYQLWFLGQELEDVNRHQLGSLIGEAEETYNRSEEGGLAGMYESGAKAELLAAINAAKAIYADLNITSEVQLAEAYNALETATKVFAKKKVLLRNTVFEYLADRVRMLLESAVEGTEQGEYTIGSKEVLQQALSSAKEKYNEGGFQIVQVSDLLKENLSNWANTEGMDVGADNAVVSGRGVTYTGQKYLDEMFTAEISLNLERWQGFMLRRQTVQSTFMGGVDTGYIILVKPDIWELQKVVSGNTVSTFLIGAPESNPQIGSIFNTHIQNEEACTVLFGAQNVDEGVRLLMIVDDEVVFDVIDTVDPISEEGYFAVVTSSTINAMTIGLDEIPRKQLQSAYDELLAAYIAFEAGKVTAPGTPQEPQNPNPPQEPQNPDTPSDVSTAPTPTPKPEAPRTVVRAEELEKAVASGKDYTVEVKNEEGKVVYGWTFTGQNLKRAGKDVMADIKLGLTVAMLDTNAAINKLLTEKNKNQTGLVISFDHEGVLPVQASVRIYVGDLGIEKNTVLYLYYHNSETGKLDVLPYTSKGFQVDKDGYITVNIVHCSDYVLLPNKADPSTYTESLAQIVLSPARVTLYTVDTKYGKSSLKAEMPSTFQLVKSLKDETLGTGVGAVTITYKSSNTKIVTVSSNGAVTAKGKGTAKITATVKLYSGLTKTVTTTVTVREPSITITGKTDTMKLGSTFIFEAAVAGYDKRDILWMTSKRNIVVINEKTGRAVARTKGTDYVEARIDGKAAKVKVVVK